MSQDEPTRAEQIADLKILLASIRERQEHTIELFNERYKDEE